MKNLLEIANKLREGFEKAEVRLTNEDKDRINNDISNLSETDFDYVLPIKNFLKTYVTDNTVRYIVESGQYARFASSPVRDDFGELNDQWRKVVREYVKDYVPLNRFM